MKIAAARAALALLLITVTALPGMAAESLKPKAGDSVYTQLMLHPQVRVVIFLQIRATDPRNLNRMQEEVWQAQESALANLGASDFELTRRFQSVPAIVGDLSEAGLRKLERLADVVRVDLDVGGSGNLAHAVPLTNTDDVHALAVTGQGITVAVLDSGIDTDHADLSDDLVDEACFCSGTGGCCPDGRKEQFGPGAAEDDHGHGSNVAGIVTSAGIVSSVGAAPDAAIVAIKVLDSSNSFSTTSDIVAALDWIILNRPDVDVVNMSLGTFAMYPGDCDGEAAWSMALASAINTLRANGVLSFVSTGNTGSLTQMQAPACIAGAISMGAVWDSDVGPRTVFGCTDNPTFADKVTCFTNRNSSTDLFAPGAPITSDYLNGGLSTFYGTSQASPHAAACAANLLQAFPGLEADILETTLESTGTVVNDPATGLQFPRVDCLAALDALACRDDDEDGFPISALCSGGLPEDCDDGNSSRFPGNPEVCDGLDNDCDGSVPPHETAPDRVAGLAMGQLQVSWSPDPLALDYDVVLGDLGLLLTGAGDFVTATTLCLANDIEATSLSHGGDPDPGAGYWLLVRPGNCAGAGSFESGGAFQSGARDPEIAAATAACP